MKKLMIIATVAALGALAGCQTAHIKTAEWEASVNSHWFKRDVDKLSVTRGADGSYTVDLNGYKGDTSEQLPAFTREMWAGIGFLGQIAASMYSPAAASVQKQQPVSTAAPASACADGSCSE